MSATKRRRPRAFGVAPEIRFARAEGLEVRSAANADEIIICGSPIVYDAPYQVVDMLGTFTERMMPGVASDVLARGADVRLLVNHGGIPFSRTTSGTMTLTDSARSLNFEARLSANSHAASDLADAISRGDVSQMSVGFRCAADEWDEDMENRTIYQFADLLDISAVTYPASPTTSIQVAERMAMEIPIESRARVRQAILRAGKVLSGQNEGDIAAATKLLHGVLASGGFDPASLLDSDDDDEGESEAGEDGSAGGGASNGEGQSTTTPDGSGLRVADLQHELAIRTKRRIDLVAGNRP
jgi:HK97 family phage prohead protease